MSKKIVLSNPGGFPWFDDYFDYLQTAWNEMCVALAQSGKAGTAAWTMYGCGITFVTGAGTMVTYTIAAGWLFYNGQLVRVPGSSVTFDSAINAAYISIVPTTLPTAVAFFDGSTPDVINDATAIITSAVIGTADTSILFKAVELSPYGKEPGYTSANINLTGGAGSWTIVGSLYYRKSYLNNTLTLHGSVVVTNGSHFTGLPAITTEVLAALAAAYRPVLNGDPVSFSCPVGGLVPYVGGASGYFTSLRAQLDAAGNLSMDFPGSTNGAYTVYIDQILKLD